VYDDFLLLERHIAGREFTLGIVDRAALPLVEIVRGERALFDYEAKYRVSDCRHVCEPRLDREIRVGLVDSALRAADALGTRGLVRVDLMLDQRGQPWVLEVNNVPGMTSQSLVPLAASHAGISMAMLCDRLVRDCLPAESLS
jgi:D-alanine-D-alanine ligase